ncbi:MAG: O-antigen ligase family protein, partial [Deltaproteobacteria bacterium]|nr:O-antigen ligase family protein [Deltaproteobacteria bacterium]
RAVLSAFLILMMVNLLGTASRGGLLTLVIAGSVFWFFSRIRHKLAIAVSVVVLFLVIFITFSLVSPNAPTERYTGETGGGSISYRIGWMKMAFAMIEDHPIIGVGTGNFVTRYNRYLTDTPEVPRSPYWTHNSYLQLWAENGIFALLGFLVLLWFCVWRMYVVVSGTTDEILRAIALLLLSVVAGYSFFAGSSNIIENENYWMVFAYTIIVYNLYKQEIEMRGKTRYDCEQ